MIRFGGYSCTACKHWYYRSQCNNR